MLHGNQPAFTKKSKRNSLEFVKWFTIEQKGAMVRGLELVGMGFGLLAGKGQQQSLASVLGKNAKHLYHGGVTIILLCSHLPQPSKSLGKLLRTVKNAKKTSATHFIC